MPTKFWGNRFLTIEEFEYAASIGGLVTHPINKPVFNRSYKKSKNVVVLRTALATYVATVNIATGQEIYNLYHP